jgi:hypothetical protein
MEQHLQELVQALATLKTKDGDPLLSSDLLDLLAASLTPSSIPSDLNPKAAEALQLAFEAMGGLPRLTLWADAHPAAFYKLFARMVTQTITPVLPRVESTQQDWPTWLTMRRLAYQERPALEDPSDGDGS